MYEASRETVIPALSVPQNSNAAHVRAEYIQLAATLHRGTEGEAGRRRSTVQRRGATAACMWVACYAQLSRGRGVIMTKPR